MAKFESEVHQQVLQQLAARDRPVLERVWQERGAQNHAVVSEALNARRSERSGRLLAALPPADFERVLGLAETVSTATGDVLWERGDPIKYVYFPIDCVLSNTLEMEDGFSSEMALIGNEGMAGLFACTGAARTPCRATVAYGGFAHRMRAGVLREQFNQAGPVQALMLRYSQALLMQVACGAACVQHHKTHAQLSRMLLSAADRLRSPILPVTHEKIAGAMGVRRETVTGALRLFIRKGLIHCERGRISLLDRPALERTACECYSSIRSEFDSMRLMFQPQH